MKTKLLAVMMMGLAAFGTISNFASAASGDETWAGAQGLNGNMGVSGVMGVSGTADGAREGSSLLTIIRTAINWVLGLLSLITLCIVLWGGFQMVTAAGDDGKYKKGFTILKQAGIGLTIIILSWIIVSAIFWVVGNAGATTGS